MSAGDRKFGPLSARGEVASTGALIQVPVDFRPSAIQLFNTTGEVSLTWFDSMPDDSGYKELGAGAFSFTPDTLYSAETLAVTNDAGAAAKNPVYVKVNRLTGELSFGIDALPSGASQPLPSGGAMTTNVGRGILMERGFVTEFQTKLIDAAAGAGDTQLFFRPDCIPEKGPILGKFVSANDGGANAMFTTVDVATGLVASEQVPVYFDANAAEDSYVVSWNSAATTGSRLCVDAQFAQTCYVQTQSGRYIELNHSAVGTDVFFDDNGATSFERLKAATGGGDQFDLCLSLFGDLQVSGNEKAFLFVKPGTVGGTYTFVFNPTTLGSLAPDGTTLYINAGERVIPVTLDSTAGTGTQVFWDQAAGAGARLRSTAATGTVALSRTNAPWGYQTTGSVAGAGGNTAFISVDGITPGSGGFSIGADADVNPAGAEVIKWVAYR